MSMENYFLKHKIQLSDVSLLYFSMGSFLWTITYVIQNRTAILYYYSINNIEQLYTHIVFSSFDSILHSPLLVTFNFVIFILTLFKTPLARAAWNSWFCSIESRPTQTHTHNTRKRTPAHNDWSARNVLSERLTKTL